MRVTDLIEAIGIVFNGPHGVTAAERTAGHRFSVDVGMEVDTAAAALADDLALTVDYGAVAALVVSIGTGPPVHLIETLAQRVADGVLRAHPIATAVQVRVSKLNPPGVVPFEAARVTIRRVRD